MRKQRKLTLSYPWRRHADADDRVEYRVEEVKNSTVFKPGERLMREEVENLCVSTAWVIKIKWSKVP